MQSILRELYYGRINPYKAKFEEDSFYQEDVKTMIDNEAKFLETLPEPEKLMFIDFVDAQAEVADTTAFEKFSYGFKLGVLLGMELVLDEEDF